MVGCAGQRSTHCEVRRGAHRRRRDKISVHKRGKTEHQLSPKRFKGALGAGEASNFAVENHLRTIGLGLLARYP